MNDFYATHSSVTDPGQYIDLFQDLPTSLAGIAYVVQGLVYHYMVDQYNFGWVPPQERLAEINTRTMERILTCLVDKDPRPLVRSRVCADRLVGCCRDFALITCAILRQQGRPARLRYGFAGYFIPGYWVDHVVVETWTGERWQRFDPQIAEQPGWDHNMLDMVDAPFVTGGCAWQMCRQEGADPDRFGLEPDEPAVRGWMFIRERLQLDVAALNKVELLCWDLWTGLSEGQPEDESILDQMATLSLDPDSRALRQRCAEEGRWRLPAMVECFHPYVGASIVNIA